jgi:hypothetical protein
MACTAASVDEEGMSDEAGIQEEELGTAELAQISCVTPPSANVSEELDWGMDFAGTAFTSPRRLWIM